MSQPVDVRPRQPRQGAKAAGQAAKRPHGPRPGQKPKVPANAKVKKPAPKQSLGQRLLQSSTVQGTVASVIVNYLSLVNRTSPLTFDPPEPYGRYVHLRPVIFTMWHGQHFMLPFAKIFDFDVRVLISRHRDGEINARVANKFGIGTIRGSTARKSKKLLQKGGMTGFLEMKTALEEGACVCMTADISNLVARRAGLGIVALARTTGRAIVPIAYATSRRLDLKSWDRATINLPFSRAVCAVSEPITVPADADDAVLEAKRREVEDALNEATARAYRLADRR